MTAVGTPPSLDVRVANLSQSVQTADYARNALAREVAHWVHTHRLADELGIIAQFMAAERRFYAYQREFNQACDELRGVAR